MTIDKTGREAENIGGRETHKSVKKAKTTAWLMMGEQVELVTAKSVVLDQ